MRTLSTERKKFHEWLEYFKTFLPKQATIYDIGKSHLHDYAQTFKDYNYLTVDREDGKGPDLLFDFEDSTIVGGMGLIDALICNGVMEQCDNPFKILKSCNHILKIGGLVLFGIISVGYPLFEDDRFRFTPNGASLAIKAKGFEIIDEKIVINEKEIPTYMFFICRKIA